MRNLRLAYITEYDADDVHNWSGLGYFIARALEQQGFHVEKIGNLNVSPLHRLGGTVKKIAHRLEGKRYLPERATSRALDFAAQIRRHPGFSSADIVFSPGSIPISFLDCPQPIVFYTDATFAGMLGFYPGFSNLCRESIRDGNGLEQSALARSQLAIYSSNWAARSAIEHYRVEPRKIKIVPFGANLEEAPTIDEVRRMVSTRETSICKLLFVGVDWERKGGDTAVEIAGELNRRGIPTELSIAGCTPPHRLPAFVKVHGFLSKASPKDLETIHRLFAEAHFLILPTRADASPLVINEACSYGLPVLVSNVGGVSDLVREEHNGKTFLPSVPVTAYADYLAGIWSRPEKYHDLALSAYDEFQNRLSWQAVGKVLRTLLEEACP